MRDTGRIARSAHGRRRANVPGGFEHRAARPATEADVAAQRSSASETQAAATACVSRRPLYPAATPRIAFRRALSQRTTCYERSSSAARMDRLRSRVARCSTKSRDARGRVAAGMQGSAWPHGQGQGAARSPAPAKIFGANVTTIKSSLSLLANRSNAHHRPARAFAGSRRLVASRAMPFSLRDRRSAL